MYQCLTCSKIGRGNGLILFRSLNSSAFECLFLSDVAICKPQETYLSYWLTVAVFCHVTIFFIFLLLMWLVSRKNYKKWMLVTHKCRLNWLAWLLKTRFLTCLTFSWICQLHFNSLCVFTCLVSRLSIFLPVQFLIFLCVSCYVNVSFWLLKNMITLCYWVIVLFVCVVTCAHAASWYSFCRQSVYLSAQNLENYWSQIDVTW